MTTDTITVERTDALVRSAKDALAIYNGGGCNVHGLTRALVRANDAAMNHPEYGGNCESSTSVLFAPARLILAQLAWLYGQGIGILNHEEDRVCEIIAGYPAIGEPPLT